MRDGELELFGQLVGKLRDTIEEFADTSVAVPDFECISIRTLKVAERLGRTEYQGPSVSSRLHEALRPIQPFLVYLQLSRNGEDGRFFPEDLSVIDESKARWDKSLRAIQEITDDPTLKSRIDGHCRATVIQALVARLAAMEVVEAMKLTDFSELNQWIESLKALTSEARSRSIGAP